MKFKVNGVEKEDYYLSNNEVVNLLKSSDLTDDEREFLRNVLMNRFENNCCVRDGETDDELFARNVGNFVNGICHNKKNVAKSLSHEHRYLQQEIFTLFLEYVKILAENANNGIYDGRNEWACLTSKEIVDHFKDIDYYI